MKLLNCVDVCELYATKNTVDQVSHSVMSSEVVLLETTEPRSKTRLGIENGLVFKHVLI